MPAEAESKPREHAVAAAARAASRWWTCVAHRIGDVQARVLLSVFSYEVLGVDDPRTDRWERRAPLPV